MTVTVTVTPRHRRSYRQRLPAEEQHYGFCPSRGQIRWRTAFLLVNGEAALAMLARCQVRARYVSGTTEPRPAVYSGSVVGKWVMETLQLIAEYLRVNKEWLFSGAGVTSVTSIAVLAAWWFRRKANAVRALRPSRAAEQPDQCDRPPRLEFSDGVVAEVTLMVEARVVDVSQFLRRFKSEAALHATFGPRLHIRMAQLMEPYSYEGAKQRRQQFERKLLKEFTPQYQEHGVRLLRVGIGSFVRKVPVRNKTI